jgi:hypothetical protein
MNPKESMLQKDYDFKSSFHLHGIFTYYRKKITLQRSFTHGTRHIESIVTGFRIQDLLLYNWKTFMLHHMHLEQLLCFLKTILSNMDQSKNRSIVGDFNINMLKNKNMQKKFSSFMKNHGLVLHTTQAKNDMGSMLDHFCSKFALDNVACIIFDAYLTDHHANFLSI